MRSRYSIGADGITELLKRRSDSTNSYLTLLPLIQRWFISCRRLMTVYSDDELLFSIKVGFEKGSTFPSYFDILILVFLLILSPIITA